MADTTYKSAYTGAQIDKAVGDVLGSDLPDLALQAKAAAQNAEAAASEAEEALKKIEEIGGSVVADISSDEGTNTLFLIDSGGNKIGNGVEIEAGLSDTEKSELKSEIESELDTGVMTVNGTEPDEAGNIELDVGVKTINGTSPDENGNVELELTGESSAITSADVVLSGTTLTITVGKADGTTSVIVGTLTEDNLLTNLSVDGTDIPVTMEGF